MTKKKSKVTQELLLGVPPANMYTVVKKDKNKKSVFYGNWVFDWNRSNSKILSYEDIENANRRKQELQRKFPNSEFMVTRNHETCPNCLQVKPMKHMIWIGFCTNCMKVLYQDFRIAYLFPDAP